MGNSCSSGQAHKDKDNASLNSDDSPSYRVTKPSIDSTAAAAGIELSDKNRHQSHDDQNTSNRLEPQTSLKDNKKPVVLKGHRNIGSSVSDSISLSSPVAVQSPRELDQSTTPTSISHLNEEHRQILIGHIPQIRIKLKWKSMIIYICAADSQDCCCEKGQLQSCVAKQLRSIARKSGWRVHVADLHWRSPLEQQRDHRFPALCTAELARQSELGALVPVLFLNNSLGTPLLPHTLESSDFETALRAVDNEDDRSLLSKWYSMDESASPPCYRLTRGAPARWRREMARTLNVLVRTLPQEACDAYLTTVVEQEVHHTVLMNMDQARRCIWVCRTGSVPEPDGDIQDQAGKLELLRRLTNLQRDLKQHLSERNIIKLSNRTLSPDDDNDYEIYLTSVRDLLLQRLGDILKQLISDYYEPVGYNGIPSRLFEELTEQAAFCQKCSELSVNRDAVLLEIKSYVNSDVNVPLVLIGGVGYGKTNFISRALLSMQNWLPDAAIVFRYVGLTSQSSTSFQILKSLVEQLQVLYNGTVYRGHNNFQSLSSALQHLLACLGQCRPLILVIIGAEKMRTATWIPSSLPDNVKLILTLTEEADEPSSSAIMAVLNSSIGPRVCKLPDISTSERRHVLSTCLAGYRHPIGLSADDNTLVQCHTPLFAKILAWEKHVVAEFSNDEESGEQPSVILCEDLEGQLNHLLDLTEKTMGSERVKVCLALITTARRGLDDTEILDILAHDSIFRSDETYLSWAPASLFWPQLAALLSNFFFWDSRGAVRWRDHALEKVVRERYADVDARDRLVKYFDGSWYNEDDSKMAGRLMSQDNCFSSDRFNTRKLDELPYHHYFQLKADPKLYANKQYFTDIEWIYQKLAATDSTHYLQDIQLVNLDPLPEHLQILKEFLEIHSSALDYDYSQFYGLLKLHFECRIHDGYRFKSEICQKWWDIVQKPPIPTLSALNEGFGQLFTDRERRQGSLTDGFESKVYDLVVQLDKGSKFVASVSTERGEICVWDATRCKKVRTLLGITHPINLIPVDRHKCVVLCRRELRVYDLDKGKFLTCLKGVMNQKMPYYGLHDSEHLVTLSRNRMYVNLMNINTGDCVTTFKAGEDRFLNSLFVSGDGRILVCGDETQKPFPLLVWSLTSRKLLYDLRIPHHEFVTSLAAITYEGTYVCVVSRELDEPSPNFIVVYDLQSGTLFKKWKPGCDTTSLAISSEQHCVVSGLKDARILLWDLVTGNCRMTLRGHTSPPTVLKISSSGSILMSADSKCHDISIRVWDLKNGEHLATYTPPERITSHEIICGGNLLLLALENYKDLVTLTFKSWSNNHRIESDSYGDPQNDGQVYDLSDTDGQT